MLALQEAQQAAEAVAAVHGAFEPTLLGWIVLLPFLGFLINGAAAIIAARRARPPSGALAGHGHASEQEHHAGGDQAHPAAIEEEHGHDHGGRDHGPRPWTHSLPSLVAPGVLIASFALALVNFFGMQGAGVHEPTVVSYWSWMPVGELQVDAALQLDSLSILMTLIITGVGSLIHIFSIGYMS